MSNIAQAIETIQDMLDVLETAGSCYVYKHNGGTDRLRNVLECLRAQQERENPEPLTLDELRKMEGELVWFVHEEYGRWRILDVICGVAREEFILFDDELSDWMADYGKTWLAYRHKPKEA